MNIFPEKIKAKIDELGFLTTAVVELYNLWSVVAIREGRHYNIQLSKENLTVESIHLLRYKWNQFGSRILNVERVLIQHKNQHKAHK
jgi:hypothetical protein